MSNNLSTSALKGELMSNVTYSDDKPLFYPVDGIFAFNSPLTVTIGNISIHVPADYKTNFGSIPWMFGWRFTGTKYPVPYGVHDALVGEFKQRKCMITYSNMSRELSWKESKLVLKRLMQEQGASKRDVSAVKAGVGIWGKIKDLF
jgi:hypothetical protein